jgi:protein SCO1/2
MRLRPRAHFLSLVVSILSIALMSAVPSNAQNTRWKDRLPNIELRTQDDKPVKFYDDVIKDRIVLFSFIYTSCLDICPLITARLAQVYEKLGTAAGRQVFFVSISIDPERDTPERLKRHADAFRSDPNWVFLTGKPDEVRKIRQNLGERSRKLTEHGSQVLLYNDRTGEWLKDSAFADLGVLVENIRNLDPEYRSKRIAVADQGSSVPKAASFDQPGQALFAKACASCHTIGKGNRVGPDLKGVTERRDRAWLERFIESPGRLHAQKDPIALELAAKYPAVRMPNLQLSTNDVQDLMTYLDARLYALAASDMAGPHSHGAHDAAASKGGGKQQGHKHGHH